MIIPDRKKAVSVILSKMKPHGMAEGGEVKDEAPVDAKDGALKAIAEDMLMAVEQKSPMDLVNALQAFMSEIEARDLEQDEAE